MVGLATRGIRHRGRVEGRPAHRSRPEPGTSGRCRGARIRAWSTSRRSTRWTASSSPRAPDADFDWRSLEGAPVVLFGGGQPLAMFKYACHKAGIDYDRIEAIHPGGAADIDRAFRDGEGAYVQQQGPFPQQPRPTGSAMSWRGRKAGRAVRLLQPVRPPRLARDRHGARLRPRLPQGATVANETPAAEVARAEKSYFDIDADVLERCIASYRLGCWSPHIEITREAFEATLDIFAYNGLIRASPTKPAPRRRRGRAKPVRSEAFLPLCPSRRRGRPSTFCFLPSSVTEKTRGCSAFAHDVRSRGRIPQQVSRSPDGIGHVVGRMVGRQVGSVRLLQPVRPYLPRLARGPTWRRVRPRLPQVRASG